MTVIFQLFCVEDLKRLGDDGRENLVSIIKAQLEPGRARGRSTQPRQPPTLTLEASNNTTLTSKEETPRDVLEALRERYAQVSQQLRARIPGDTTEPALDPSKELLPQLQSPVPSSPSTQDENQIVQWAISCEVNHYNFYYPLLEIREKAYEMFRNRTGQDPRGPDSLYSPFNPLHPLYDLFTRVYGGS